MEQIYEYYLQYGYIFVFVGALLESFLLTTIFLPGSVIVLMGGYFAKENQTSLVVVIICGWIGMFLGNVANYFLGSKRVFASLENNKIVGFFKKRAGTARWYLERYGVWAIFLLHVLGNFRTIIGFIAGRLGYPFKKFLAVVLVSSFFWSLFFVMVGFFLAHQVGDIRDISTKIGFITFGIFLLFLLLQMGDLLIKKGKRQTIL